MANDCRNTLTFISKKGTPSNPIGAILKPYLSKEADGLYNLDFGKIIAPRKDLVAVWGTSRNAYETELEEVDVDGKNKGATPLANLDSLVFFTSWDPPIPVIRELARLTGASLRLAYFDQHEWLVGGVYIVDPSGVERDERYTDPSKVRDKALRKELNCEFFTKKITLSPKVRGLVDEPAMRTKSARNPVRKAPVKKAQAPLKAKASAGKKSLAVKPTKSKKEAKITKAPGKASAK